MSTETDLEIGDAPPTLRLRGPGDIVDAVPYLLGFHPRDSIVLLGLAQCRVVVTVRFDLDDLAEPGVLPQALAAICRGACEQVIAVLYDDAAVPCPGEPMPWRDVAHALGEQCRRLGCAVGDVLLVAGGRWWSFTCTVPGCCPPSGRPLPTGSSTVAAAATFAGMVALPDRAALAAQLDPFPEAVRDRIRPLIEAHERAAVRAALDATVAKHDRSVKRAIFATARATDEGRTESGQLDDSTIARFAAALSSYATRDPLWMALDAGRLDGRPLWREIARRAPSPYDAAPLFLFGWRSWRAGNGAMAGIAAERAIASDPGYSAADLLLAALARGLDPRELPRLRTPRRSG